MVNADLHIHSQFSSDGEFDVAEIIHQCIAQKVSTFSITDHNSTKSAAEAAPLAQQRGMNFISGIEIDCTYKGTNLHVLGYNINSASNDFRELEEAIFSKVIYSFTEMIRNTNKEGFAIDAEAVLAEAKGKLPTGELIAEVMLADKKYHTPQLLPYMQGGREKRYAVHQLLSGLLCTG